MVAENTGESIPQSAATTSADAACGPDTPSASLPEITDDIYCPECGYNLRGLTGNRCPECGHDIQIIRERKTQIPWVYRDKEGSFRAYWRTVWMVMFQNQRFCLEISRPVDEGHARRYRWVTVLHAYLPILAITLSWPVSGLTAVTFETCVYMAVVHVGIIACVLLLTAIPYYALYHRDVPLEKQHRAAVLMLYACAPLAWIFLVALLAVAAFVAAKTRSESWALGCGMAAFLVLGSLLAIMLTDLQRIIKRILHEPRAVFWITAKLIALSMVTGLLTLVGIPFAAVFLAVVYYSLQ